MKTKAVTGIMLASLLIGMVTLAFDTAHVSMYALAGDVYWYIETVDSSFSVGGHTSLALDSADRPHISYYDHTNGNLKWAYYTGIDWHIETVDSVGQVGSYTSIAIEDWTDWPHISYYDYTNMDLKYAHYNYYTGWETETVDSVGQVGWDTSLALDGNRLPHISYYDVTPHDLKYAHYNGTSWEIETVDSLAQVGRHSSLALDSSGYPHISYSRNVGLRYAYFDGTTWHIETVDTTCDLRYTSLALDSSGYPHISYDSLTDGLKHLKYAYFNGTSWEIETVESKEGLDFESSIALDSSDLPHISYLGYAYDLKYAHYNGTSWHTQLLDSIGSVGWYNSISLSSDDNPHISYYDNTNDDLKFAFSLGEPVYTLTITAASGGTTDPPLGTHTYVNGSSVQVEAFPNTGYMFDHWELDGSSNDSNPISVTMDSDYTLHAVFNYDVTIQAYCDNEGQYVSVSITMDESPIVYDTPHNFIGLIGTHTFTVSDTDPLGHPFKKWSTHETNATITVTTPGTYTAYYRLEYTLNIITTLGGSTNPHPGTHAYLAGSSVQVWAIPMVGYAFDHWELDDSLNYYNLLIYVTMDSDHTLLAVFKGTKVLLRVACGEPLCAPT